MVNSADIRDLQGRYGKLRDEQQQLSGALETWMKQLRDEFKCKTIVQAKKKLGVLEAEFTTLEKNLQDLFNLAEEAIDKIEESVNES